MKLIKILQWEMELPMPLNLRLSSEVNLCSNFFLMEGMNGVVSTYSQILPPSGPKFNPH